MMAADATDDFRGAVLDGGSGKAALTVYECTLNSHGCAPGSVKSKQHARAKADAVAAIRAADALAARDDRDASAQHWSDGRRASSDDSR